METIIKELGNNLIAHHYSLSSTESFTVGHFASAIGLVPGISAIYRGSLVSYQTRIKHDVLHVHQNTIDQYGVVSAEVAHAMCTNGQMLFDSDICISFTGNAGPSAMEGKPVGLIYIGIAFFDEVSTYEYHLNGTREDIVHQAIKIGAQEILKKIHEKS